jgi:predicted nucleic acid-binding protein
VADVYLDACCFIYLAEGEPAWRAAVEHRLRALSSSTRLVTSQLTRLECRTKPTRDNDRALLERYDALFAASRVVVVEVSASVIDRATLLRAKHGLKSPDAIHLATAIEHGASSLWTADAAFARAGEIAVELLVQRTS